MAAFISASIGRTTENSRMLDAAERLGRETLGIGGAASHVEARARTALAVVAEERGDRPSAREHYYALLPYRGVMTNGHPPVTDRVLGLLAQTLGRIDDAASHFEDALAFCRDRFHGEQGHVSYEYAVLLFSRRGPGDRERATELMFNAYGKCFWVSHDRMRPLHKKVMDLQRVEGWTYAARELHLSIEGGALRRLPSPIPIYAGADEPPTHIRESRYHIGRHDARSGNRQERQEQTGLAGADGRRGGVRYLWSRRVGANRADRRDT